MSVPKSKSERRCVMTNASKMLMLKQENERLKYENEKLKANLDFVAIMTDVEIPEEQEDIYEPEN